MRLLQAQLGRLAGTRRGEIAERVLGRARAFRRRQWYPHDEAGTAALVAACIARAEARGAVRMERIVPYVEGALVLGFRFEDDPLLPWASRALEEHPVEGRRVAPWRERADEHIAAVVGEGGEHQARALRAFVEGPLPETAGLSPERFDAAVLASFERLHPRKCAAVGEEALARLLSAGRTLAPRPDLKTPEVLCLYSHLQLLLGSVFVQDPRCAFAPRALRVLPGEPPSVRASRLRAAARERISAWLAGGGSAGV